MTEVAFLAFEKPWREYWTEQKRFELEQLVAPANMELAELLIKLAFIEGIIKGLPE